jgi:hypothetical protein
VYIQYSGSSSSRAPGPIARFVAAIVAAAVLVLAFFLGVVFLISAVIALTIIGGVLSYRARKYRSRGGPRPAADGSRRQGEVLEGEWREVRPSDRQGPDGR